MPNAAIDRVMSALVKVGGAQYREDKARRADQAWNREVPASFAGAIRSRADDHQAGGRRDVGNCRKQHDRCGAETAGRLHDLRQPEADAVKRDHDKRYTVEIAQRRPLRAAAQNVRCAPAVCACSAAISFANHSRSAGSSQVASLGRSVSLSSTTGASRIAGKPSIRNSHCQPRSPTTPSSCSSALEIGAPMTPAMAVAVMNSADGCARARGREPVREVEDQAGKESGLRRTEQERAGVERERAVDEHHRRRHHAPREHDARNPDAGAEPDQHQIARALRAAYSSGKIGRTPIRRRRR